MQQYVRLASCLTSLLFQTDTNMDTGEPLDKLSSGARAWCQEIGSSATTVSEIINGPDEKVCVYKREVVLTTEFLR